MEDALIPLSSIVLFILVAYWLISAGVRSGIKSSVPQAKAYEPPVAPVARPGRYKVAGVDRMSRMDCVQYYRASGPDNARAKAELDDMVVTSVEYDNA